MSPQESEKGTAITLGTVVSAVDMVYADMKNPRTVSFQDQLFTSLALLRKKGITQKDFFERLMQEGDGKWLSTVVSIDNGKKTAGIFFLERTGGDNQKLLIRTPHQDDAPSVMLRVGLNKKGQLAVEEVKAQFCDAKTGQLREVKGDTITAGTPRIAVSKKELGEILLRIFVKDAVPFKESDEDLDAHPVADGDGKAIAVARLPE